MKTAGISLLSVVPVRAEPSEKSEMTSQLLFGEYFAITEKTEKWLHIRSEIDGYQGWVSRNMASDLPDDFPPASGLRVICSPFETYVIKDKNRYVHLPGGSLIPSTKEDTSFQIAETRYARCNSMLQYENSSLAELAAQYLGAPYLWGGKTIFGIDCSGLVQIVCRMAGYSLPRDASQQAQTGSKVAPDNAQTNDIAFFSNDNGNIVHVGILCDANSIIHASGHVRIDKFDEHGIFNEAENRYTHRLHSIIMVNG